MSLRIVMQFAHESFFGICCFYERIWLNIINPRVLKLEHGLYMKMLDSFTVCLTVKECDEFTRSFCSIRLWEITSFLRVCNEIVQSFNFTLNYLMHDFIKYILGDIFFGTTTTESKNIVKLLAISQTIHTVYCEDNYFPKGKFKLLKGLFHSV